MSSVENNDKTLGRKFDQGKPQWRLLPWKPLAQVVSVLTFGAVKYEPDNWKHVPAAQDRYTDAALRHITSYLQDETLDPESGKPHLAHAICCLLFLMWFDEKEGKYNE